MKPYCAQNDGDCSPCSLVNYGRDCANNRVAALTPHDARALLDDAVASLGQEAHERWAGCSRHDKNEAVNRVQYGELSEVVAHDFAD